MGYLSKNNFSRSDVRNSILDIFKNVHFAKVPIGSGKKGEKTTCDHYALIFVFCWKML